MHSNLFNLLFIPFLKSTLLFTRSALFASSQSQSSSTVPMIYLIPAFSPLLLPVRIGPDVEEAPAAIEDQSESTQSDSDDCIVHGQASGRKVSETPVYLPQNRENLGQRMWSLCRDGPRILGVHSRVDGKHCCTHVVIVE